MTTLADHQFELLPTMTATNGQTFGIGLDMSLNSDGFHPGDDDWTTEDDVNPVRGGVNFGNDTLNGPTWGWDLHVNRGTESEALDTLSLFRTAWRAAQIRSTPGAVIPIRYQLNGRARRIYGRPRRYSGPPDNRILTGTVPVTVDFQCADSYTYSDQESQITLPAQIGSSGGLIFPIVFPSSTLPVGSANQSVLVAGDAPTYPVITFIGPLINPSLSTPNWTLSLPGLSIPVSSQVVVDLRPWAMTALQDGSASVAGYLAKGTGQYLSDMKLQPGSTAMNFRANTGSDAGSCTVKWRNAYNSI